VAVESSAELRQKGSISLSLSPGSSVLKVDITIQTPQPEVKITMEIYHSHSIETVILED
jgi:hypothetical protein